jgi:hypothetical protein
VRSRGAFRHYPCPPLVQVPTRQNTALERLSGPSLGTSRTSLLDSLADLQGPADLRPGLWPDELDGRLIGVWLRQVFEIYADSEAVVAHHISEGFMMQNWAGRFMDCVDSTRCVVFGDPNASAREILDRLGATYYSAWGGFSRF